jgi:hypothetical protein
VIHASTEKKQENIFLVVKNELKNKLKELQKSFKLSIQPLNRFLGVEIKQLRDGIIFIHQEKYIMYRFGMSECKTADIPMPEGSKPADTQYEYQELVGSLLFLTRCTRPDIAYAVHYFV